MRFFVAAIVVAAVAAASAQAPLPAALRDARRVYLTSNGVEREWLDRLAKAFQKAKRFELVGDAGDADVIVSLGRGKGAEIATAVPGLPMAIGLENEAFHLTVVDAISKAVLWDDHREAGLTVGGAVDGLSKRLHDALKKQ